MGQGQYLHHAPSPIAEGTGMHCPTVVHHRPVRQPHGAPARVFSWVPPASSVHSTQKDTPAIGSAAKPLWASPPREEKFTPAGAAKFVICDDTIDTSLAHLKTTMQMDVLHCQAVPGVLKELTMFALVYNLVRVVMWHSAVPQHIAVERISFLDALRWLGAPRTGRPLIALIVNPAHPYRVEPRVKKRRPKSFPLMIKPRQALHRQLVQQTLGG
jgi:hypothetical protein